MIINLTVIGKSVWNMTFSLPGLERGCLSSTWPSPRTARCSRPLSLARRRSQDRGEVFVEGNRLRGQDMH